MLPGDVCKMPTIENCVLYMHGDFLLLFDHKDRNSLQFLETIVVNLIMKVEIPHSDCQMIVQRCNGFLNYLQNPKSLLRIFLL